MPENEDDRISNFIDESGLKDDQKIIIDVLESVKQKIMEVDAVKLTLFGSNTISQVISALKLLNTEQQKLDATEQKSLQLSILRTKERKERIRLQQEELLAQQKLEQQIAKTEAAKARADRATNPVRKSSAAATTADDGPFKELVAQAKLAKEAYNDLLVQQQQGFSINRKDLTDAKQKWKDLEMQIQQVKVTSKGALNEGAVATRNNRISFLKKEITDVNKEIAVTMLRMEQLGKTQIGRNSQEFKTLAANADIYLSQIKLLET